MSIVAQVCEVVEQRRTGRGQEGEEGEQNEPHHLRVAVDYRSVYGNVESLMGTSIMYGPGRLSRRIAQARALCWSECCALQGMSTMGR